MTPSVDQLVAAGDIVYFEQSPGQVHLLSRRTLANRQPPEIGGKNLYDEVRSGLAEGRHGFMVAMEAALAGGSGRLLETFAEIEASEEVLRGLELAADLVGDSTGEPGDRDKAWDLLKLAERKAALLALVTRFTDSGDSKARDSALAKVRALGSREEVDAIPSVQEARATVEAAVRADGIARRLAGLARDRGELEEALANAKDAVELEMARIEPWFNGVLAKGSSILLNSATVDSVLADALAGGLEARLLLTLVLMAGADTARSAYLHEARDCSPAAHYRLCEAADKFATGIVIVASTEGQDPSSAREGWRLYTGVEHETRALMWLLGSQHGEEE